MADEGFLPSNYEVPSNSGSYMRLQKGDNRFRFLSNPIMGSEWWVTLPDGKRSPRRIKMGEPVPMAELEEDNPPRHFWAMVVYNYATEKIEILELTQKRIQSAITSLYANPKWGNPKDYDLNINKSGEGRETVYQVQPEPKEKISQDIIDKLAETDINLEALYDGGNPFAGSGEAELNVDDIKF